MTTFRYDPDIVERFPNVVGGVLLADGLTGGHTPAALAEAFVAEQQATLARIGETPLSELPSLAAWRRQGAAIQKGGRGCRRIGAESASSNRRRPRSDARCGGRPRHSSPASAAVR